jgi:thymidylate kinase
MRVAWPPLFTLDMAIAAWRKVLRPLDQGEWVICDRFVLDAVVDLAATQSIVEGYLGNRLLRLLPDDARTLVLDTDPVTAFERKLDVLDPSYLIQRHALFRTVATRTGTPITGRNR